MYKLYEVYSFNDGIMEQNVIVHLIKLFFMNLLFFQISELRCHPQQFYLDPNS